MKVLIALSALVAFAAAAALTPAELELLEAFDFDTLLANDEETKMYIIDCFLKKGNCGVYKYKQIAELSIKLMINRCAECSPTQKVRYDCVLKQLHDEYEPLYNEVIKKVAAKKE